MINTYILYYIELNINLKTLNEYIKYRTQEK